MLIFQLLLERSVHCEPARFLKLLFVGKYRIGQIIVGAKGRIVVEWCSGQIRGAMGYLPGSRLDVPQPKMGEDLWEKF